jgi:excisionase family DNA binding protein
MTYTLGTAAKATGTSKSTIFRAIKSGRISATRKETGDWSIDPAELHRVFPPVREGEKRAGNAAAERGATALEQAEKAILEAQITSLRHIADLLRGQLDDTQRDRDAWRDQAQSAQRLLIDARPKRPGFFGRVFMRSKAA